MAAVRFNLKYHSIKDQDIIQALRECGNINDYIRRLIRSDVIMQKLFEDMGGNEDHGEEEICIDEFQQEVSDV